MKEIKLRSTRVNSISTCTGNIERFYEYWGAATRTLTAYRAGPVVALLPPVPPSNVDQHANLLRAADRSASVGAEEHAPLFRRIVLRPVRRRSSGRRPAAIDHRVITKSLHPVCRPTRDRPYRSATAPEGTAPRSPRSWPYDGLAALIGTHGNDARREHDNAPVSSSGKRSNHTPPILFGEPLDSRDGGRIIGKPRHGRTTCFDDLAQDRFPPRRSVARCRGIVRYRERLGLTALIARAMARMDQAAALT